MHASKPELSSAYKMSKACSHSFSILKSDSTLVQWICKCCHSGPHWLIFECIYCKLHVCRACTQSV